MKTVRLTTRDSYGWYENLNRLGRGELESVRSNGALEAHRGIGRAGYLPHQDWVVLSDLERAGILVASVYSYSTPIAVCLRAGSGAATWVMLPGHYTKTTSRHQNVIRVSPQDERRTVGFAALDELTRLTPDERETALSLLPDWYGPFADLLDAARVLLVRSGKES